MILKFLSVDQEYIINEYFDIDDNKIKINSAEIPAIKGGFIIVDEDGSEKDYSKYSLVYDKGDNYIVFTSDTNIYYTFFIYEPHSNFVIDKVVRTTNSCYDFESGILYQKGQGKIFTEPKIELINKNGFFNYKVVDGKILPTTEADESDWNDLQKRLEVQNTKINKLIEIQEDCSKAITSGIDYNGSHYSYTSEDQSNITNAITLAQNTGLDIPYHADGESCRLFTLNELIAIYVAEETNLTHNTTYYNQLKLFVESLKTKEAIETIHYGETALTGEYLNIYNLIMAQSQVIINKFLGVE